MKRILIIAALSLASLCSQVQAAEKLSYNYIAGGYVNVDVDGLSEEFDGFGLNASLNFGDSNFYGTVTYAYADVVGIDFDQTDLAIGYHHSLSDNADLLAEVAYVNAGVEGFDADGWRVGTGVRGMISDNLEGVAKVNYVDCGSCEGDFSFNLGLNYHFSDTWGIQGGVDFNEDVNIYSVGLRATF